jgi:transcriptional regulator with XRE-family HTH domain
MFASRAKARDELGQRLRLARSARGLSLEGLSAIVGISAHTVWRYEHGRIAASAETLLAIAITCGVSVDWLLTGRGRGPSHALRATGTDS